MNGVEVHFLIPVHTFADCVQVGVNVGGGIGFSEGTQTQSGGFTFTSTQPGQPPVVTTETFFSEDEAAGNIIGVVVPLFKVEFQAGLFVAPGLRVNISVGVNAPAPVGVRIGATYLFGSR